MVRKARAFHCNGRCVRKVLLCFCLSIMLCLCDLPLQGMHSFTSYAGSSLYNIIRNKKTGFYYYGGEWYYYKKGKVKTGWITVGKRTYYGKKSGSKKGALYKGFHTISGKEVFFRTSGKKKIICSLCSDANYKINGILCTFNSDGTFKKYYYAGETSSFIGKIGELARDNQRKNNICASLCVAQACLETGYGKNIYYNNLFGIVNGTSYARYSSWKASIKGWNEWMRTYLPGIFGIRNAYTCIAMVGAKGYASASNYASSLKWIYNNFNLARFSR